MLAVEGMDDVVLVDVDLLVNRQIFLDEVDELFHLLTEELFDIIHEFDFQEVDPLLAGTLLRPSLAPRTRIDQSLHLKLSETIHGSNGPLCSHRPSIRSKLSILVVVVDIELIHVSATLARVSASAACSRGQLVAIRLEATGGLSAITSQLRLRRIHYVGAL